MVQSLIRYRWLLYELVIRDLVLRYRGSVLGFVWTLLNPLLFMLVYTLVFSVYFKSGIANFPVFLIAGLIPWQWFGTAVALGTSSIVDGGMYVGKAVFAPAILVVVPVFSNLVNFLLSLPILLVIAVLFGMHIGWPILVLPVLVGIQFMLTVGILMLLATVNVFFRDLQQLIAIILQLLFYLTPIFYPIGAVPERVRPLLFINPMAPIILGYQRIFYYDMLPSWKLTAYALVVSLVVFAVGRYVFNRYQDAFADFV